MVYLILMFISGGLQMGYELRSMIDMGLTSEEIQKYHNMDAHIIVEAVCDVISDVTSDRTCIG